MLETVLNGYAECIPRAMQQANIMEMHLVLCTYIISDMIVFGGQNL